MAKQTTNEIRTIVNVPLEGDEPDGFADVLS